jgi:hypothetical protein
VLSKQISAGDHSESFEEHIALPLVNGFNNLVSA